MLDFSFIIVSYHSRVDIEGLLRSLPDSVSGASWCAVVVNNAPEDDLSSLMDGEDRVRVVTAAGNLGYSGGINVGTRAAPAARITVVLNPDLTATQGSMAALARALDAGAAAAVPAIIDEGGRRQDSIRREPTLAGTLGDSLFGSRWPRRPAVLSETERDPDAYTLLHAVDWATGAALAVRTETAAALGEWDETRFFMYSEETDYARRIRNTGGRIVFVPDAVVVHRGGGSGRSPQLDALLEVNKLRYYRKWHGRLPSLAFSAILVLRNLVRPHRPGARAALAALLSPAARAALPGGPR